MESISKFYLISSVVIGFLIIVGVLALCFIPISYVTGEGNQVGYVSATEKSGFIFKTGVAYIKPTLESTQEDIYCVMDDSILKTLQDTSDSKQTVKIYHKSWLSTGIKCGAESAFIYKVEVIK